jgi:hypothetical protein
MQKVHIRHLFGLHLPLRAQIAGEVTLLHQNPFGIAFKDSNNHSFQYQLRLHCITDGQHSALNLTNWATWAKRNPICYSNNTEKQGESEGIIAQLKINHGLFDFRKLNEQLARITLNYFVNGVLVQQGSSPVIKILPKKRHGSISDEGKLK